jgi:hypothetical protein
MGKSIESADDLLKEIDKGGQVIRDINILFLDVSSTCTGYSIINLNFHSKEAKLTKAGAIWFDPNWSHADKYSYMFHALVTYFWIVEKIDYIVVEQYSINPKKMAGVHVVPEMMGVIKVAANENGVKVDSILPQSWRKLLGIKKENDDWKLPTKNKVLETVPNIPEESISNITNNTRRTPFDLYDAIAIGLAWVGKVGFTRVSASQVKFNQHVGCLE